MTVGCGIGQTLIVEGRFGGDRRRRPPSAFSRYWLHGRRKSIRRESDRSRHVRLDSHSAELFSVIMLTLLFSLLDAALTLFLTGRGATEINPVMAFYLKMGPSVFVGAKYFLTCAAIIILLLLKHMNLFNSRFKVRSVIFFAPLPFYLVLQWHFFLIHLQ